MTPVRLLLAPWRSKAALVAPLLLQAACAFLPHFPAEGLPPGTNGQTLSDMTMIGTRSEFEAFRSEWPSICEIVDGADTCFVAYRGIYDGSYPLVPKRQAVVSLPGGFVCYFRAYRPTDREAWNVARTQYRNGDFVGAGPPNPFGLSVEPTAEVFAQLCRTLPRR